MLSNFKAGLMDKTTHKHYINLLLEEQNVLLPIESMTMVLAFAALQKIPSSDIAFQGILNFHGKSLPVYDLLMLIDEKKQINITSDTQLLMSVVDSKEIGLIVSEAKELVAIETTSMQAPPLDAMPYVKFIYETQDTVAWGLDLVALTTFRRLQLYSEKCDG